MDSEGKKWNRAIILKSDYCENTTLNLKQNSAIAFHCIRLFYAHEKKNNFIFIFVCDSRQKKNNAQSIKTKQPLCFKREMYNFIRINDFFKSTF